ncbi:MAG: adenine phosphoribosyltransferase [Candidatus Hodarchaeota archaeon]
MGSNKRLIALSQLESIFRKAWAVELLALLKTKYSYQEIEQFTKEMKIFTDSEGEPKPLSKTILNRYVRGHVLPRGQRTEKLIDLCLSKLDLRKAVRERIRWEGQFIDNTALLSDIRLLGMIAIDVARIYSPQGITKLLTAAVDGIPIAALIARELRCELIIAKKSREVGVQAYHEETYIPSGSGTVQTLYIPKKALNNRDRVLICDDIIRSGHTQRALINLARGSKSTIGGVFILIAINGGEWKNAINTGNVEVYVSLSPPI